MCNAGEEYKQLEQQSMAANIDQGAGVGEMYHEGRTAARFNLKSEMAITKKHNCKEAQTASIWGKS